MLDDRRKDVSSADCRNGRGQGGRERSDKTARRGTEQCIFAALRGGQTETRIKAEKVSAAQQLNMASSKAQLELKRELSGTQARLKQQLFEEVETLLQDYMKTEEYRHLLVHYIEKAASFADGEEMTIYINPSDADKKEYLEEHTGMRVTVSKEDFKGGIRAVLRQRNILIDHAFKGALEREYQQFLFRGGVEGA